MTNVRKHKRGESLVWIKKIIVSVYNLCKGKKTLRSLQKFRKMKEKMLGEHCSTLRNHEKMQFRPFSYALCLQKEKELKFNYVHSVKCKYFSEIQRYANIFLMCQVLRNLRFFLLKY